MWSEFTPLANKHNAVNLGQGFPDWATPDFVKEALVQVTSLQQLKNSILVALVSNYIVGYTF